MTEYIVTVEFWAQSDRPVEEVRECLVRILSERDFNDADVSGWDVTAAKEA